MSDKNHLCDINDVDEQIIEELNRNDKIGYSIIAITSFIIALFTWVIVKIIGYIIV